MSQKEYPDYYPEIMQDYHDQKDLIKLFYDWLVDMDNELDDKNELVKRRSDFCSWIGFHILIVSFIQFLHQYGWQIYRSRKHDTFKMLDADILDMKIRMIKNID